jgi:catechol 2,3-dioxygenase-like lactoylglutathione lyase family enzyme
MSAIIDNVVFACPDSSPDVSYPETARPIVSFYAGLLGMRLIREDWPMLSTEVDDLPRLALGDGPGEYRPPRWPDPAYPQQLHLDFPVSDLAAADELAVRLGATRLADHGEHRVYADPIGHPFCFYLDPAAGPQVGGRLRVGRVVVDCFSPRALAGFYSELLDFPTWELDTPSRVVIARDGDAGPALAFQHGQFPAPRWPDPAYPQQVHLDIWIKDPEEARKRGELALQLGAIRLPALGGSAPVYADPAGHPFCLVTEGQ